MIRLLPRWRAVVPALLTGALLALPASGEGVREPFTRLYDTRVPLDGTLDTGAGSEAAGWQRVPEDETAHAFQGDALFENDGISVVIQGGGAGVDLYTRDGGGRVKQAVLKPAPAAAYGPIRSVEVQKNAPDAVSVDVLFDGSGDVPKGIRVELLVGQRFVRVGALGGTAALRVEVPSAFVVLPDFFADDIVVAAGDLPAATVELPSENFLLNLARGGDALVMNVWGNRDQDVRVISGRGEAGPSIEATEITFGSGGNVWVAALAETGIWHHRDIALSEKDQILPLDWRAPFDAVWRVDWRRSDGLTDSWEMAVEEGDGRFRKSELFEVSRDTWTDEDWWASDRPRWRWNAGVGSYWYPCWFDRAGRAYLQPLKKTLEFEGPAVIYPISRSAQTPLNQFSVVDVVRATLGVGPCQYILDVEGQGMAFQGRPTCDIRDDLNALYGRGEHLARKDEVHQALDDVEAFIQLIRDRIEEYAAFARDTKTYLARAYNREGAPDPALLELLKPIRQLEEAIERRREGIHTQAYAAELVGEFRRSLVDYEGADAAARCRAITAKFVEIGENQDHLVAECRLAVRLLRQRAALALAEDPAAAEIVQEIRKRTREVLRAPVNYEAARH